jgi:RNA polymerase-binding transcription factor DksA
LIHVNGGGDGPVETGLTMNRKRKPAMTPVEYAKAYLSNRREDLVQRLDSVERSRRRSDGVLSADSAEQAVETENDEVLDRLAESTRIELSHLDHAMHRLDGGRYGECEICGRPIGDRRLEALPEATQCARCARASRGA